MSPRSTDMSNDIRDIPEACLVELAREDREAFGILYDRHYRTILRYVFRRTLDMDVAEDITANTFLKALKGLPSYKPNRPFLAWLYRIASNELRMYWRYQQRHSTKQEEERWRKWLGQISFADPAIHDKTEVAETMREYGRMLALLQRLPEKYQSALTLRYIEGMGYTEICSVLNCRMGTLKSLIHRGLKRLRRELERSDAT